jgi:hypothetical protein
LTDETDFTGRPENISSSYRLVVQHGFKTEDLRICGTNRDLSEASVAEKKHYRSQLDLWAIIKTVHEGLSEDYNLLHLNFTAIGLILLQFVEALSVHMGWSFIIEDVIRKRHGAHSGKLLKGNAPKSLTNADLCLDYIGLSHFWGRLLSCIDRGSTEQTIPEFDMDKVSAFAKTFFNDLVQRRYVYFDERLTSGSETLQPATL